MIKGKKNFGIDDSYVSTILSKYLKNDYFNGLFKKDLDLIIKNKKFKQLTKEIRKQLYKNYGVFQIKKQSKKNKLLVELQKTENLDAIKKLSKEILKLHTSSRERLENYSKVYNLIFNITGKPKSILDLACGLNPCSIILSQFKGNYFAYDISKSDVDFLNNYFKEVSKFGIFGKARVRNIVDYFNYEKADVCFLFKFLDLANKRIIFFNNLIDNINCKYLVVSFSKKTISLKNMRNIERKWFVNLLGKINLNYERLDTENEIFYIINRE